MYAENVPALAAPYLHGADPRDPRASPLYADLSRLPPLLLQVSGSEVLLDDSVRVHEKACAAGTASVLRVYEGMPHVWQAMVGIIPEARAALREIAEFVEQQWAARAEAAAAHVEA
jgi:acetyl esterase/lipase